MSVTATETPKGWTPEKLSAFIEEVCGKAVNERLEALNKRVTDQGAWITTTETQLKAETIAREIASNRDKGLTFAGVLGAVAASKGDLERAVAYAKGKKMDDVVKALEASSFSAGGALIQAEVSSDFIDLLTPRAVVRSFGTTVIPMDSGVMQIQKLTAASSAYYIGESRDITKSQQSFGMKQLSAKKLAVLVPISNDLLRRGGPKVNTIVRNDALRSISLKEDLTFIRAQGSAFSPRGLRYHAAAANILTAQTAFNLTKVTQDLGSMVLALEEANVAFGNPGWMLAPRVKQYLMTVRDGNGNFAFRDEMLTGKLWGFPFKSTTQIPRNLGSGDKSEIYLVDFDDVLIGQTLNLEVAISSEASYKDENDDLVSAFSLDQTVLRMLLEHDLQVRYDESVAVLTDVDWAPTA